MPTPRLPTPVPPKPSVDDLIANETHIEYQHAHKNDKRGVNIASLFDYARGNRHIVIPAAACLLLVFGGVTAVMVTSSNDKKTLSSEEKEEALEEEGLYGVDPDEYYDYDDSDELALSDGSTKDEASSEGDSGTLPIGTANGSISVPGSTSNSKTLNSSVSKPSTAKPSSPKKPAPSTTKPSPAAPKSSTINVASWNYPHSRSVSGMVNGVKNLSSTVDVLGLQEFGPSEKRSALKNLVNSCGSCGYALYMPALKNGGNLPIVWKKSKFKLLSTGNVLVYNTQKAEYAAGSSTANRKHITWVRLQDRNTNRTFYHVNLHLTPGYSKNGKPHPDRPIRVKLYKKHMSMLVDKVKVFKTSGTVFITGDFNINHKTDKSVRHKAMPYMRLGSVNLYSNWHHLGLTQSATHPGGYIDNVFLLKSSHAIPKSHKTMPKYNSDHSPIRLTTELKS